MMAHDSTRRPDALAEETLAAIRHELTRYVSDTHDSEALRRALQHVAHEAREKQMLPEQMLIVLKDVWRSIPAVQNVTEPSEQVRMLQRVVTMCIKEYYATDR